MANSALHAIAIEELRHSDPSFHDEYCKLIEGITQLIREIAKDRPDELDYTSFTESYDRASAEPVLQVVIGANKNETFVHVYIRKDKSFVIGKSGEGKPVKTADQALELIKQLLHTN
jgi:uncharacterized protein YpmB